MKKRTSTRRPPKPVSHTGVALLVCFILATLAVALSLRQISLERQLKQPQSTIDSTLTGSYKVTTSSATSRTRSITLTLSADRTAILSYQDPSAKQVEERSGSWSGDSNGTIITNFGDSVYAFSYLSDGTGSLKLLNPDVEFWGAATLTLTKQ